MAAAWWRERVRQREDAARRARCGLPPLLPLEETPDVSVRDAGSPGARVELPDPNTSGVSSSGNESGAAS